MINPSVVFKLKGLQQRFVADHPKFPSFLQAIKNKGVPEGTVVTLKLEYPNGEVLESNIKVTANDVNSFNELSRLSQNN